MKGIKTLAYDASGRKITVILSGGHGLNAIMKEMDDGSLRVTFEDRNGTLIKAVTVMKSDLFTVLLSMNEY